MHYTSSASAGFLASSLLVISFTRSDCTSASRDWKLDRSNLHAYIHTYNSSEHENDELSNERERIDTFGKSDFTFVHVLYLHETLHGPACDDIGFADFICDERALSKEFLSSQSNQLFFPIDMDIE